MLLLSQARFGEDRYPIGRFVLERSRALGISRSDLEGVVLLVHQQGEEQILAVVYLSAYNLGEPLQPAQMVLVTSLYKLSGRPQRPRAPAAHAEGLL
jgi:hypothetical protein